MKTQFTRTLKAAACLLTFWATTSSLAQLAASAADGAASAASSTGVFASAVATAGSLIAAATAFTLCWKGRFNWEPAEQDVPRASQKVCGLLIGIAIAIMWYRFTRLHTLLADDLTSYSVYFGIAALAFLLIYSLLIGIYVYSKLVVVDPDNHVGETKVIGGLWLTDHAKAVLRSGPLTIALVFKGSGYNEDLVWSRISRGLAKLLFQLGYVGLVGAGTCALASISLLIASTA